MAEEHALQNQIIDFLRKTGVFHLRLNSGKVRTRGGFIQLCPTGTPDLVAFPSDGSVRWIELKRKKGKTHAAGTRSPEQVEFEELSDNLGHYYLVADSLDSVIEYMGK